MLRLILLLVVICAPTLATAAPVDVRATEDARATRIKIDFEKRPKWLQQKTGRGFRLVFADPAQSGYDLSQTFQAIGRDRISDIRVLDARTLEFDLACDCSFHAADGANETLSVEVSDRPLVERSGTDAPRLLSPSVVDVADALVSRGKDPRPSQMGQTRLQSPSVEENSFGVLSPEPESLSIFIGELSREDDVGGQGTAVRLLGEAFSRAAAQGLIAADGDVQSRTTNQTRHPDGLGAGLSNLSVTTGFDALETAENRAVPPTEAGAVCLSDAQVDFVSWGQVGDHSALGKRRSASVAESGSVDAAGALELAKLYLWMGFGAEAAQAIWFYPEGPDRRLIEALANIMDHGVSGSDALDGQIHCEGAISLWGALADDISSDKVPETADHILSAFSALPPHLRSHLGPLLSERLHAVGLEGAARTALNAVTRGGKKTDESTLATARLDLSGTHAEDARDVLADLSTGTDMTAAQALLELLRDAEARDMPPNPDWVKDAPTLVGALEGTKIAEELNIAGLRGLVALKRIDEFRSLIVEDSPGLTPDIRSELVVHAVTVSTANFDDAVFLRAEIGLSRLVPPTELPADLRHSVAKRMAALGLHDRALPYISQTPSLISELRVGYDVLKSLGLTEEALELVVGSDIQGREAILADALIASGRDEEALRIFDAAGDLDTAIGTAMRIGEWSWLSDNSSEPYANAVRALLTEELSLPADTPNGALIQNSRENRSHIDSLLKATQPPDS